MPPLHLPRQRLPGKLVQLPPLLLYPSLSSSSNIICDKYTFAFLQQLSLIYSLGPHLLGDMHHIAPMLPQGHETSGDIYS